MHFYSENDRNSLFLIKSASGYSRFLFLYFSFSVWEAIFFSFVAEKMATEMVSKASLFAVANQNRLNDRISVFPKGCVSSCSMSSGFPSLKVKSQPFRLSSSLNSDFHGNRVVFHERKGMPWNRNSSKSSIVSQVNRVFLFLLLFFYLIFCVYVSCFFIFLCIFFLVFFPLLYDLIVIRAFRDLIYIPKFILLFKCKMF